MSAMSTDTSPAFYTGNTSSWNSNARFYDVSWLVSGMVVKEWESFCPCTLSIPPLTSSAHEQPVAVVDSSYIMSCPAPTVESFSSLMPGLLPDHIHSAGSVKSYALRSSHFHPTKQPICPVPTLWFDVPLPSENVASAECNADIVKWLASPECKITRLIVAGPPHLESESLNSETQSYMSSFISSVLNELLEATTTSIRYLVFYRCSLSDVTLWPLLGILLTRRNCPLESLACVHLQSGEVVQNLLQILQHPQSKLLELILHGVSSFSFNDLVDTLNSPHSQLRRLSLTACSIGDKEMEEISLVLSSPSCKLTAINLSANVFTEVGLHHLQKALIEAYSTTPGAHPLEMLSLCGRQVYARDEEVTKAMTEILKTPGCALTTLDLTGRRLDPRWLAHLLGILKASSHRKRLKSLYLLHAPCVSSDRAPNDYLIEAVKASTHILNIHFPWPTEAHKQIADAVMRRNERLEATKTVQQEQQMEKPSRIKLFLCGHERVGKTTLRKKLLHSSSVYNLSNRAKQGVRIKEPLTQGMNLSLLELRRKTTSVVICDLAGQREYHAFHTFFMTSTNEDLFAVVCKYTEDQRLFEARLQYWLRFIVSHRMQAQPKPMVMLVVNFFDSRMNTEQMSDYARKATEGTMRKFSTVLDFGQSDGINAFGVKLSSVRSSKCTAPIMSTVETLSYKLLDRKPLVPRICKEISLAIDHKERMSLDKIRSKPAPSIITVQELLKKYESSRMRTQATSRNEFAATPSDMAFEEALLELHKIGKVVYFRNDAVEDLCLEKQLVILDPVWFYETLVGSLVKPRSKPDAPSVGSSHNGQSGWVWTKADIRQMFTEENLCKAEHSDHVIKYLEKLQLFFPINSGPDPRHNVQLIFPALISAPAQEAKFNHWIEMGMNLEQYSFFGRRLDSKERDTGFIPFGVFARLQVQLHEVYGKSCRRYEIGYGWIEFHVEDNIEVFIRFEGFSNQPEEDRHWIDTIVRFPTVLYGLREKAADIICKVNDSVFSICRGLDRGSCAGVDLEEFVLLEASRPKAMPLLELKEKVHLLVLEGQSSLNIGPTDCAKLLFPQEWREIIKQMEAAIQEMAEEFADSPDLEAIHHEANLQLIALQGLSESGFESGSNLHKLIEFSDKYSGSIYSKLSEQQLRRPDVSAPHTPENALPICPFLVDEQGKFRRKLMEMVHVRGARLHLMCESFHGCHEVRNQKGVAIALGSPNERLVRSTSVLATALKLVFAAAMIAAVSFSPPAASFFPLLWESLGLNEFIKKHMKFSIPHHNVAYPQLLSSYLDGLPDVQQNLFLAQGYTSGLPSGHFLRQFYKYVLEGHEKDVDMERDFSLYHVYFPAKGRSLWVCNTHVSGGKEQRHNFNPFKDLS